MAALLPQLQVFNSRARIAMLDRLAYAVDEWDGRGGGNLVSITPRQVEGDFLDEAFPKDMMGRAGIVDVNTDTANTVVQYQEGLKRSVKFAFSSGTIQADPMAFNWTLQQQALAGTLFGTQFGAVTRKIFIDAAINALVGIIGGNAALNINKIGTKKNASEGEAPSYENMAEAAGLLGDRQFDLVGWIMHGTAFNAFQANLLKNNKQMLSAPIPLSEGGITRDYQGRPILVIDHPALVVRRTIESTANRPTYTTLGLVRQAVDIYNSNDLFVNPDFSNGRTLIGRTFQGEATAAIGVKGYTFTSSGGKSPVLADLKTTASWSRTVASNKDGPGVALNCYFTPA